MLIVQMPHGGDISSGDVLTASISTVQEAADDAWKACEPTLNAAGETVRDGARNGAYLGGRFVLGVADVGENAYVGVESNIELLAEDEEAAVKTAQTHAVDDAATPGATSWKPMSRYGKSETMSKLEAKSPLSCAWCRSRHRFCPCSTRCWVCTRS